FPGLFVIELIQLMMERHGVWTDHKKELAWVAGELLHPAIITAPFVQPAPTAIQSWMSSSREGWYGGGLGPSHPLGPSPLYGSDVLFIYFQKSQLGLSMEQIVQSPGPTLEDRYHQLSPTAGSGFYSFKAVLDPFSPPRAPLPARDDLFPLG